MQERRENLRLHWREPALLIGMAGACALWIALDDSTPRRVIASLLLGVALTILTVGWIMAFDAHSLRWLWGAAGEEWTADELDRLSPEWHVFHDIGHGWGNWDHVVIGPSGVYAIDSKNLRSPAIVDDNGLRSGRLRVDAGKVRGSAVRLKEVLEKECGRAVWVQAVVTVWGELAVDSPIQRDRVLYIRGRDLVCMLESRPECLSARDSGELAVALEAYTLASASRTDSS